MTGTRSGARPYARGSRGRDAASCRRRIGGSTRTLGRTVRALDPRGVPRSLDSRLASGISAGRSASTSRTTTGSGIVGDRKPADQGRGASSQHGRSNSSTSASRRAAQLLPTRGVMTGVGGFGGSAEERDITGFAIRHNFPLPLRRERNVFPVDPERHVSDWRGRRSACGRNLCPCGNTM